MPSGPEGTPSSSSKYRNVTGAMNTPTRKGKLKAHESLQEVPDSEEERQRSSMKEDKHTMYRTTSQVIEIESSDEESDAENTPDPFSTPTLPGSWPRSPGKKGNPKKMPSVIQPPKKKFPPARRVVESSDSEDDSPAREVISLLSDSDSDKAVTPPPQRRRKPEAKPAVPKLSLYEDIGDEELETNELYYQHDEAILVLNEPKSHKKVRIIQDPNTPRKGTQQSISAASTSTVTSDIFTSISVSTSAVQKSPTKKRSSAKAEKEARFNELKNYAEELYAELNQTVFGGKLPPSPLQWNVRLYSTAGKASWHRSSDGVETSVIQLAIKILDNEDRIRRTLAHEMCHLACWVIDKNPKESHGPLFKSWGRRVEARRPDITVSTTHDYDINYPYNWKCADCNLIYGRFSKSIDPTKHGCGTCGSARLIPQFETKSRTPKTPRVSRMAASKPRDSPSAIVPSPSTPSTSQSSLLSDDDEIEISCIQHSPGREKVTDSDSDSDIEFIATKLATTKV
ncbi:hypothetical protein D9758_012240 [Tetrapyrgos nigripes]|uniref:SprT-like domain-containing protein n=1 Tax=Tetrapyrgos nigripes TaxID=182062 RepID=A0A8H5FIV0_9AGAR|nr:hypothetical protein D9758_012240 [Tetrapyrgos nigripes]